MTEHITIKEVEVEGFVITAKAACYNEGAMWHFEDQWEALREHTQGAIRNPCIERSSDTKFFMPLQYTLDQLTKDFAAQGRANPPREAYESLQRQLRYDIWAQDCGLEVSVSYNDISLVENKHEIGFIWSPEGDSDLEEEGRRIVEEYFDEKEWVSNGRSALAELRSAICAC